MWSNRRSRHQLSDDRLEIGCIFYINKDIERNIIYVEMVQDIEVGGD